MKRWRTEGKYYRQYLDLQMDACGQLISLLEKRNFDISSWQEALSKRTIHEHIIM